jgi:peptidyl-prolyl cis-trans isomerase SurA
MMKLSWKYFLTKLFQQKGMISFSKTKQMRIRSLICVLTLLLGLCMANALYANPVDRVVAVVNEDIITQVQLDKETEQYRKQIEFSGESEIRKKQMMQQINQKALDALIDQLLTRQEAKKYNVNISDADVDETIKRMMNDQNIDPESMKALVEKQLEQQGMDYEEYREDIRKKILQARVVRAAVQSKVIITDTEVQKFYEENKESFAGQTHVHLKNILMGDRAKIEKIKKRLDNKGNFEVLAKLYSSSSNAKEGGDLGTFNISNFSEEIQKGVAPLKKGEHTDVIETPQGYQIFYVADIIEKGASTLEQAKPEIYEILYKERIDRKLKTWIESLKKDAYIRMMIE